jgi:sorbitol/mannitol transport system permease protein
MMATAISAPVSKTNGKGTVGASYKKKGVGSALTTIGTWIIGLIFIAPVFFMVLTGFHPEVKASLNAPQLFAPLTLNGYRQFFGSSSGQSPWPFVINSAIASIVSTLLVLCFAIPAAYALSVKPVRKWTDVMFFFLSTKFLPAAAGLVPLFVIARSIGGLNHLWFMIILYMAMNLPIAVWMMRSFLADIPPALFEAASLDGAGLIKTLIKVIAPIAGPGIASTSLICFIFSWNELFLVNVLTSTSQAQTLPAFLPSLVTSQALFLGKLCAAATAVSLPVLIAGFAAQDKLVQGLSLGAVK